MDWGCHSVAECLPSMHEALGSIPNTAKQTKLNREQGTKFNKMELTSGKCEVCPWA
jgi:hypothetical protein